MNFANPILREGSPVTKARFCVVPFHERPERGKSLETESGYVAAKSGEFSWDGLLLELDPGDACTRPHLPK